MLTKYKELDIGLIGACVGNFLGIIASFFHYSEGSLKTTFPSSLHECDEIIAKNCLTLILPLTLAFGAIFMVGYMIIEDTTASVDNAPQRERGLQELLENDEEESNSSAYDGYSADEDFEENEHERILRKAGFEGEIPDEYKDPVTRDIMVNPVILLTKDKSTSHSYDEITALRLMREKKPICPILRVKFKGYILNRDLKNLIQKWVDETVANLKKAALISLPRHIASKELIKSQSFFHNKLACSQPKKNMTKHQRKFSV